MTYRIGAIDTALVLLWRGEAIAVVAVHHRASARTEFHVRISMVFVSAQFVARWDFCAQYRLRDKEEQETSHGIKTSTHFSRFMVVRVLGLFAISTPHKSRYRDGVIFFCMYFF